MTSDEPDSYHQQASSGVYPGGRALSCFAQLASLPAAGRTNCKSLIPTAPLYTVQARFAQHGDDVAEADMTMAAVKVREKASSFLCPSEVDRKHSSTRLQNPSHRAGALLACLAGQMMKHNHAHYSVEFIVGKRHRLGKLILEDNLDPCLSRFLGRPGKHLRRGIDPAHR